MPERDQPNLDRVRDAMREHDERREQEPREDAPPPEPYGEDDEEDEG